VAPKCSVEVHRLRIVVVVCLCVCVFVYFCGGLPSFPTSLVGLRACGDDEEQARKKKKKLRLAR